MEKDLERYEQDKKGVWVNKGGEIKIPPGGENKIPPGAEIKFPPKVKHIKITPKLKHTWTKGPGKSHQHSTYGGTVGFKKGKFSVEGTWKKDKGKHNESSYQSKPSKSIILKMAFGKGGLMRTPKLAKRGF
tara:strand:+ start:119 stop:511 length:393 start_codon:yes stop_codon:yes gene_type:complete